MLKRSLFVLIVLVLNLSAVSAVLAVAPATGEVIEGQSVPGISLGDTRAAVEAA